MGVVRGLYRVDRETIEYLLREPEKADDYIGEHYCSVTGKFHRYEDIVFETDKAWRLVDYLLKKIDPSPEKVLSKLPGSVIGGPIEWPSVLYIDQYDVKSIHSALEQIQPAQLMAAYDMADFRDWDIYWMDLHTPDWDYLLLQLDAMKKAFSKAAQHDEWIINYLH